MKMSQNHKTLLKLAPALLFLGVFFAGGLIRGVAGSLVPLPPFYGGGSAYGRLVDSPAFRESLQLTLKAAGLSTLGASFLGMGLIYLVYSRMREGASCRWFKRLLHTPMLFPYLMAAFMVHGLLSRTGLLSRAAYALGLSAGASGFPDLVNDPGGAGIQIAYLWKTTPFVFLMLYPTLERMETGLYEMGRVFGAGKARFFREILIPMLLPAWTGAALIVLAYTLTAFEVPYLLGLTHPKMLPVFAFDLFVRGDFAERPVALAVNVLLLALLLGLYALAFRRMGKAGFLDGREAEPDE